MSGNEVQTGSSGWEEERAKLLAEIDKLKDESRRKTEFIVDLSHKLRTPITALLGMTTLAGKNIDDKNLLTEYLGKMEFSVRVLLSTANDILDSDAIANGKFYINASRFNFKLVLSSASTVFFRQCNDKNIQYDISLHGVTEETLIGDQLRLNQILFNLLSYAVKYTPPGGRVHLDVTQHSKDSSNVVMEFTITDNGRGMTPDELASALSGETIDRNDQYNGSSGLAITKNLAELMRGSLTVTSNKGEGTVYTASLPFGAVPSESHISKDKMSGFSVLLVDDDFSSREYVSTVLERIGVDFVAAASGDEALVSITESSAAGKHFSLCLLDWCPPSSDALTLTKYMRRYLGDKASIVIYTSLDTSDASDAARGAGADRLLPKPIFQSTLFNLITELSGSQYTKLTADPSKYDFTGRRVLLAEDNALNAEITEEILSSVGFVVHWAENGLDAVDLFTGASPGTYDVILMDVQMPVMDGYEATRAIRAVNRYDSASIPIIALTADAFAEDIELARAAGMNAHVSKPIDTQLLFQTLENLMLFKENDSEQ